MSAAIAHKLAVRWRLPNALHAGIALVGIWLFLAAFGGTVAPYDAIAQNLQDTLQPPSWRHLLGTDNFGRDIFSRILTGVRVDLAMGVIAVVIPFCCGSIVGAIAGYTGGIADAVLMRGVFSRPRCGATTPKMRHRFNPRGHTDHADVSKAATAGHRLIECIGCRHARHARSPG